jgi:hypothetical protein
MLGDIQIFDEGAFGYPGDDIAVVAAGTCAQKIKAGEPLYIAVNGGNVATALVTSYPTSGDAAHNISGIASSTSTDTVASAGTVRYTKLSPLTTYLISPNVAASWDTQAEYDALVGKFVTLDLTGTAALGTATYTINATHNAAYGCVVEPLDIARFPGKVRFSIRPAATSKGWATGIS